MSVAKFTRRLMNIEKGLLHAQTKPRLPYSSIDDGTLVVNDAFGNTQAIIGNQWDGTITSSSVGGSTPVAPTVPLVTPRPNGLAIYWDGTYVDGSPTRMDFQRVTFHAVTDVDDFDALDPAQIVGEITIATGGEIYATLPPVEHFVFAVTWSDAGKFSVESDVAFGTPLALADDPAFTDALDEIEAVKGDISSVPLTFRQPTQPTTEELDGRKAVWYDTDGGNAPWFYDGAAWTAIEFGNEALAASAVIAETIATGALDGKQITGPLIQTLSDAALGIKLINNTMIAFDESGNVVFLLDADTGDVTLAGALLTGGEISGATVTGSRFRTATVGERIEINTASDSFVRFYSGESFETSPSLIQAFAGATNTGILITSGLADGHPAKRAELGVVTTSTGVTAAEIFAEQITLDTIEGSADGPSIFMTAVGAYGSGGSRTGNLNIHAGALADAGVSGVQTLIEGYGKTGAGAVTGKVTLKTDTKSIEVAEQTKAITLTGDTHVVGNSFTSEVRGWSKSATADTVVSTSTPTAVTGLSQVVPVPARPDTSVQLPTYMVTAVYDVTKEGSNGIFVGDLTVDGAVQSSQVIMNQAVSGERLTAAQTWLITPVSSGNVTFACRAYVSGGSSGSWRVSTTHSTLTIVRIN
jgi:hypothetical protein